jgi:hypothetical protein
MASMDSDAGGRSGGGGSGAHAAVPAPPGGLDSIFAELTPVRQGSGASGVSHASSRRGQR